MFFNHKSKLMSFNHKSKFMSLRNLIMNQNLCHLIINQNLCHEGTRLWLVARPGCLADQAAVITGHLPPECSKGRGEGQRENLRRAAAASSATGAVI